MKNAHSIGWAAAMSMKTTAPILDRTKFYWNNAASHTDPSKFRARQEARRIAAQSKPAANITVLPNKKEVA